MATSITGAIQVDHKPSQDHLAALGVEKWGIWTKEVSTFPWHYDMQETCYFLEGEVIVTPHGGQPVLMGKGDLVTFADGLSCSWQILKDVKKFYSFG